MSHDASTLSDRRTAKVLLALEAYAVLSLRGAVRHATTKLVAQVAIATIRAQEVLVLASGAAQDLEREIAHRLTAARQAARLGGEANLRASAKRIGMPMPPAPGPGPSATPPLHPYRDSGRAAVGARTAATSWLQGTLAQASTAEDRRDLAPALSKAPGIIGPRIDRLAATETADAFNAARSDLVESLAAEPWAPEWRQRWCAILDARTCERCAAMNGKTRPLNAARAFGAGEPPIHPFCRCFIVLEPALARRAA